MIHCICRTHECTQNDFYKALNSPIIAAYITAVEKGDVGHVHVLAQGQQSLFARGTYSRFSSTSTSSSATVATRVGIPYTPLIKLYISPYTIYDVMVGWLVGWFGDQGKKGCSCW